MTSKSILLGFCCMLILPSFSQQSRQYNLFLGGSSNAGNYIYLLNGKDLQDPEMLASFHHFIIKRVTVPSNTDSASFALLEKSLKVIGEARKPATSSELKDKIPAVGIKAMKDAFKLKTDKDLINYLQGHSKPEDYILFYSVIETKLALAHVYLDKDVKEGEAYLYHVFMIDKNNQEHYWGKTMILGKTGNYRLPFYHAIATSRIIKDSSISFSWALPLKINTDTIQRPSKRLNFDKEGNLYNTFFNPKAIRVSFNLGVNGEWKKETGRIFPQPNAAGDTLFYTYSQRFNPGAIISAFVVPEDELHNEGKPSDTINAFLITEKNAPRIGKLIVKDTLNGISLSWEPLPLSPFISGVQIIRYGLENTVDTLPLLPVSDTNFIDYAIKAGVNYRYEVRALYLPGMAVYQTMASNSFSTLTKFSRPTPPYHLTAVNEGKNIRLRWQIAKNPTINTFFVYRGLTPTSLKLLPARITDTTYLDTTVELSGGSQYFYAVNCQNLKQDSSIYSNIASAIPDRKLSIAPPREMSFYYANKIIYVNWSDCRKYNNQVKSFLVEKRLKGVLTFKVLAPKPVEQTTLEDTAAIQPGEVYQYRVAAVSFKGDTSQYSETFEYTLDKARVPELDSFVLNNKANGINVCLPPVAYENRKAYNIFRRTVAEKTFTKIATIDSEQFIYVDKEVKVGETYLYAVSVMEKDGREGKMGRIVSVRRQ